MKTMNPKDPGFFKDFGVPFAWGYWDARTSGTAKPPTKLIREELQAYELGFREGMRDKATAAIEQKLAT